jgi:hypothetical protein
MEMRVDCGFAIWIWVLFFVWFTDSWEVDVTCEATATALNTTTTQQ